MDAQGTDVLDLSHPGKRYLIGNVHQCQPRINEFLDSDVMADA
jgi:hypothetical protein